MKKVNPLLFLLFCTIFIQCVSKKRPIIYNTADLEPRSNFISPSCSEYASYIPDTSISGADITYTLNMIFHIIEGPLEKSNFDLESGRKYFSDMINNCNLRLSLNEKMKLPKNNTTPVYDPKIRLTISTRGYKNVSTFYHHVETDPSLAYFLNKGLGQNNYNVRIINKYAIRNDSLLNVFVMSFPPKLIKSYPAEYHGSGIALGSSIKMGGMFQKGGPDWGYATMFTHEVGHVLNLNHAWVNDGCDDTPVNSNCFGDGTGPCAPDGVASNNLMDYNNSQMAITPCQVGKMRESLAREGNFQRKLIDFDFCNPTDDMEIIISKKTEWKGERDVNRSLVIENGGSLRLCCRLSLPKGGYIKIKKGGELILDNVKIHNACGYEILGVIKEAGGKLHINNNLSRD